MGRLVCECGFRHHCRYASLCSLFVYHSLAPSFSLSHTHTFSFILLHSPQAARQGERSTSSITSSSNSPSTLRGYSEETMRPPRRCIHACSLFLSHSFTHLLSHSLFRSLSRFLSLPLSFKVAGHEIRGLNAYLSCGLRGLCFPLMVSVDFLGYRVLAMSVLPIDQTTIRYGSADGGKVVCVCVCCVCGS